MHIGICLHGIHYLNNEMLNYDYDKCIKNNEKFIFNNLKENGHTIDFFINTYDSIKLPKLLEYFKPVSTIINKFNYVYNDIMLPVINQRNNFGMIKEYINKTNTQYDLIITIRLDLIFFKYFSDMNYKNDKINIVHEHVFLNQDGLFNCEDNFFIIPAKFIDTMFYALYKLNNCSLHEINHYLLKNEIHYMYKNMQEDSPQYTDQRYYSVNRTKFTENPVVDHVTVRFNNINKYYGTNITREYLCIN